MEGSLPPKVRACRVASQKLCGPHSRAPRGSQPRRGLQLTESVPYPPREHWEARVPKQHGWTRRINHRFQAVLPDPEFKKGTALLVFPLIG